MLQTSINSLNTQKMIDEHVHQDTFTSPLHTLPGNVRRHLNYNLFRMKEELTQLISQKMQTDTVDSEPASQRSCAITMKH